jgi:hypothetical protein
MAVLISADVQAIASPVDVLATEETVILTGSALSLTSDHAKAVIRGWVDLDVPTGATAAVLAIYDGEDITGRLVGNNAADVTSVTAGSRAHLTIELTDLLQNVGEAQYTLSCDLTAATADGQAANALLETMLLTG